MILKCTSLSVQLRFHTLLIQFDVCFASDCGAGGHSWPSSEWSGFRSGPAAFWSILKRTTSRRERGGLALSTLTLQGFWENYELGRETLESAAAGLHDPGDANVVASLREVKPAQKH